VVILPHRTLREAADLMVSEKVGRLPVVAALGHELLGIVTRSDLLGAHERRLDESQRSEEGWWPRQSRQAAP
jgi:CBS-domain-containing membrane protein